MGIERSLLFWEIYSNKGITLLVFFLAKDLIFSTLVLLDNRAPLNCSMEYSSESTGSSPPSRFIEIDIKDLKKKIKGISRVLGRIDVEGGFRFDNIYKDMDHVKKEG